VTTTSPKVNIYHHCQTGPLSSTARRGEGRHKKITRTVDCQGPAAVRPWDPVGVWHILWPAFGLRLCFALAKQGASSAGSTHRALHLQQE